VLDERALRDVGSKERRELDESDALESDCDVGQDGHRQAVVAHDCPFDHTDADGDDDEECHRRNVTFQSDRAVQLRELLVSGLDLVVGRGTGGHFISRCVTKGCQRAIAYSSIYLQNCQYAVHW